MTTRKEFENAVKVLMKNPNILILDEPTNNLDVKTIRWLEDFILNFENTIIIMTSNAGSNLNNNSIGFGKESITDTNKLIGALKELFRPEFLNRVDEIITFNPLTKEELVQIVDLLLEKTQNALSSKEIILEVSDDAKRFLAEKGTDLKYGARPLRRAIQRYIEDEISELILKSILNDGQKITITFDTELHFNVQ